MRKNFSGILSGLMLVFSSFSTYAYNKQELPAYQEKYKDQMAVVLDHTQTVSIEVDDKTGELMVFETDYEEILYLKESSKFYTSQSIYTSDFFEDIVEIEVRVYNKKGKSYKLSQSEFQIVDSPPSSWVFHDDDKELIYEFRSLGEGYRTVVEYKKRIKRPQFFDVFHFMSIYPVEHTALEIVHPASTKLNYFEQNFENHEVNRETVDLKKGLKKTTWTLNDLDAYKTEDGSTNVKYHIPHLLAQIVSYKSNGKEERLIGTPKELHSFFQEFLLLREQDEENGNGKGQTKGGMEDIVNEITSGMETPLEKMDTIFSWVQSNIKYIAFEDGINGYVPRSCTEVMTNRYGDCKDMGNLLVEMLGYAGVEGAKVAWVGTRDIPYQMSEIPTPLACNHVICVVEKEEDDYYYLDATHAQGGYELPPYNVQGKELLIHNGMDEFTLFKVPEVEADINYLKSVIRYHWDEDDSLRGTGTDYYGGYERERRTYYLDNLDDEDLFDYVKELALGGYNRYTLTGYSIENLTRKNEELIINYDFSVDNLFLAYEGDLILNPTLFKPRVTQYNTEDHSMDRFKKYHRTVDYQFEFQIPDGYRVTHVPENIRHEHELFDFKATFGESGEYLVVNMKYQYHLLEIPTELYSEWNAFSAAINRATIQNVIFQKI